MNKRLIIIAGTVYPEPSPTGKCALQYAELLKNSFDVEIVSSNKTKREALFIEQNGYNVHILSCTRLLVEGWFEQLALKCKVPFSKKLYFYGRDLMRAIGRIQSMILFPDNNRWYYKKAYRLLLKLEKGRSIDAVFTINSTISAHLAGERFKIKHKDVRWISFTIDPYSVPRTVKNLWYSLDRKKMIERKVLSGCDVVLLSEEVFESRPDLYSGSEHKTQAIPYLLPDNEFVTEQTKHPYFNPKTINLVYAGSFYKEIRNPEFLFQLIQACDDRNIVLHLFCTSDCKDLIDHYVKASQGKIIKHEPVSSRIIHDIYNQADILVNVGNSISEFKPSKIFEYISTGKPIININYPGAKDDVLNKYPLTLQITRQKDMNNLLLNDFHDFCTLNKCQRVPSEIIKEIFNKHSKETLFTILSNSILS